MDREVRERTPRTSAGVLTLIRFQWRAYWRRVARGGKLTVGNQGMTLILLGVVLVKYVQKLRIATIDLSQGKTALLESLLGGICLAWLFAAASRDQSSVATRRWLHLPLSLKKLFAVRVVSQMMPPFAWMVMAGSLAICYPTAYARRPLLGTLAALLFISMSWLAGLTLAHLVSMAFWRRVLGAITLVLLSGVALYFVTGNEPQRPSDLSVLVPMTPMTLVGRAALGQQSWVAILVLGTLTVVTFCTAVWSFRQSLENVSSRSVKKPSYFASVRIPGKLGGLVAKDVRYLWRLLDTYLGLLAAATGCLYLVSTATPTVDIFLIFLTLIFLPNSPLSFNCFGLDRVPGLNRYILMPLTGQRIMLSKNLAFLSVVGVQACPLLLLACWQVGASAGALGLVTFASLASACLTWGNWMSLSHPKKMQFFRFSSSSASLFDAMAGVIFSSSPGILIIYLLHSQYYSVLSLALVVLLFGLLYWFSLVRFGSRFDQQRDVIARALS